MRIIKSPITQKQNLRNQTGLASILVTMIIMIVISLIVLGAAQLARRGQRQTLDRQLSTQAYYAAESGVNDAVKAIETELAANGTALTGNDRTTDCSEFMTDAGLTSPTLKDNVKYTCLLVDPTPTTWEGTVGDTSRTTPIRDKNGQPIGSITIAWQSNDNSSDFTGCATNFQPETGAGARTCRTPILRFDLVSTATPTRAGLNSSVMTGFLLPVPSGVPNLAFTPAAVGTSPAISCNAATTPKYCKVTITGLSATGYYLKMRSIYGSSAVTVSASASNTENPKLELKDSQIVIDSTGKANDVLRRIQVRVPFSGALNIPEFAIESGDTICKQLNVISGNATAANGLPACQP